jgi:uncharacterized protein YndB with AHSA1/START domain
MGVHGQAEVSPSLLWKPDPKLDLVLERVVDASRDLVWIALTKPEHVSSGFRQRPGPLRTARSICGQGYFRFVMRSPEGEEFPNICCYLEVVPNERLVWTDALLPGYRPSENPFLTAILALEALGNTTRYTAMAIHRDEATRKRHEEMGFHDGWGKSLDQLVAHVKRM